jgi:hypothetical protein
MLIIDVTARTLASTTIASSFWCGCLSLGALQWAKINERATG